MIPVGILDRQVVVAESLALTLKTFEEVDAMVLTNDLVSIIDAVRTNGVNIILLNMHGNESSDLETMKHVLERFDRLRGVVMSSHIAQRSVVNAIKCGVKGFISPEANLEELHRALLTVRGGYDYWSSDIANMLIQGYVSESMPAPEAPSVDMLSARQIEILRMWGENKSNREIADKLFLSIRTVETHKNHIMQKLNLKTTVDMVRFGIRNNIIEL